MKKKGKKGGGKKKEPKVDPAVLAAEKEAREKATQERLDTLWEKVKCTGELTHKYARQIADLREQAKKREQDSTDMVLYLEQEVKRKENANTKLSRHVKELEAMQISDTKTMKRHFEATLKRAEKVFLAKESQLLEKNQELTKEVNALNQFKLMRNEFTSELEATKTKINQNEIRHRQQLDALEKMFLLARTRLERDASERISQSRKVYKEEVGRELDMDSKKVREDNRRMERALQSQQECSDRLQENVTNMQTSIKVLKMDLDLSRQKDKEYIRKHKRNQIKMNDAQEEVKNMEQALRQLLKEQDNEAEHTDKRSRSELELLEEQVNKYQLELENVIRMLEKFRIHAKTVLQQKKETENFFLTEVQTEMENIKQQKLLQHQQAKIDYSNSIRNRVGGSLRNRDLDHIYPTVLRAQSAPHRDELGLDLKNNNQTTNNTNTNMGEIKEATDPIEELTGLPRLTLLRMIYARINNASVQHMLGPENSLPPHSFQSEIMGGTKMQNVDFGGLPWEFSMGI